MLEFLKQKVWQVDGITITVGAILLVLLVGFLIIRR